VSAPTRLHMHMQSVQLLSGLTDTGSIIPVFPVSQETWEPSKAAAIRGASEQKKRVVWVTSCPPQLECSPK
jgi:hypothetical protein